MVTVKEFRDIHGLSESAFKRLVNRTLKNTGNPNRESVVGRTEGNVHTVHRPDLLTAQLESERSVKAVKTHETHRETVESLDVEIIDIEPYQFSSKLVPTNDRYRLQGRSDLSAMAASLDENAIVLAELDRLVSKGDVFLDKLVSDGEEAARHAKQQRDAYIQRVDYLNAKVQAAQRQQMVARAEREVTERVTQVKKQEAIDLAATLRALQLEE